MGFWAYLPFFLLSPVTKTGEGVRDVPAAWAGGPGDSAAAVGRGKRERGATGNLFPTSIWARV